MRKNTTQIVQEKQLEGMMKRPIPKKKVGIIHLEMVRESRILYGMRRFSQPDEAVDMVRPLFAMADRELMLVMSLNTKLEPMAVEIAAVGGLNVCSVDVRNLFKHALLNNAAYIICFHLPLYVLLQTLAINSLCIFHWMIEQKQQE